MKKKINIGFDIGTTSVGWSIIDEDNNIINMGVRLFEDPANPKDGTLANAKRRSARSARRGISRTRTRKNALTKFLINQKWVSDAEELSNLINIDINEFNVANPVELKVKALSEKVSKEALIFILFHYIHHRGFFFITEEMLKNESIWAENDSYPSVELLEFYKTNKYYKGASINENFSSRRYSREITKLLETQGVDKNFIEEYLKIFNSIRDFSQGPGSEKSPTKYGMYYSKNGEVVKKEGNSLWDSTVGKCIYTQKNRGLKNSPIAELFNLLNDINNISIASNSKRKLTNEEKDIIFESLTEPFKSDKKNIHISLKLLEKLLDVKKRELIISGYKIDSDKKALFTKLDNYFVIIKFLKENKIWTKDINLFDMELINKSNDLFCELAKFNDALKRKEYLINEFNISDEKALELTKSVKNLTQTHSLSYEAMLNFIRNCKNDEMNSMQFFSKVYGPLVNNKFANKKYIPEGIYDDEIISPTVRRAFNQNIKVMNKIIKFYMKDYDLNNITFELARDKNSAEEREKIRKSQKENSNDVKLILEEYGNGKADLSDKKLPREKLKLWKEQGFIDIYDGQRIEFEDVLNSNQYEIEHIIPFSISNMNARHNKVLTKRCLNQEKGDNTPYQWLSAKGKFEKFKSRVEKLIVNERKRENLLYMDDPIANMRGFIERNLVDTRYASRVVMNTFQDFFSQNSEAYPNVKIKVINGSITAYARRNMFGVYKRREEYEHHAIDATIVNYLGSSANMNKLLNRSKEREENLLNFYDYSKTTNDKEKYSIVNNHTGEVIDLHSTYKTDDNVVKIKNQIIDYKDNNKVKFSRQLRTRNNVQLSNETIYSFKWTDKNKTIGNIITKYDLLCNDWKKQLIPLFLEGSTDTEKLENLLVFKLDSNLYAKLKIIFNQFYSEEKNNPFIQYMKLVHDIDNPKFVSIENQRVLKLRCLDEVKEIDNVIVLKKHNNNAIMASLNTIEIRLYKDVNEKWKVVPINQKLIQCVNGEVYLKKLKLDALLDSNKISNSKFIKITNGTVLISKKDDKLFYCNGGGHFKANQIEIKPLFHDNEDYFKRKRTQISISSIVRDYDITQVDELGNIYNRNNFDIN